MYALIAIAALAGEPNPDDIDRYLEACARGNNPRLIELVAEREQIYQDSRGKRKPENAAQIAAVRRVAAQRAARVRELQGKINAIVKSDPIPPPAFELPAQVGDIGSFWTPNAKFVRRITGEICEVEVPPSPRIPGLTRQNMTASLEPSVYGKFLLIAELPADIQPGVEVLVDGTWECVEINYDEKTPRGVYARNGMDDVIKWLESHQAEARRRIAELRASR